MPKILKDGGIVEDQSLLIESGAEDEVARASGVRHFLPLQVWLDLPPDVDRFQVRPGVWIEGNDGLEMLQAQLADIPAIAIRFNSFSDGTGFSIGALLREYGFEGELRACGDLVVDQALQLRRCGFNVIALKQGECLDTALAMLVGANLTYQGSIYSPRTPFKFRF
ncbi:MAG: hypothetical protein ACJAWL_001056 [Motiliproteus sp.]|jgi:uncharacterized protein (DUF934 family)